MTITRITSTAPTADPVRANSMTIHRIQVIQRLPLTPLTGWVVTAMIEALLPLLTRLLELEQVKV